MDICTTFLLALGAILIGDLVILLNAHRIIKRKAPDPMMSGGEVKPASDPVTLVRFAVGLSMITVIGIFGYLLSQNGCLA